MKRGRPTGSHPAPRSCDCTLSIFAPSTCRRDFDRAGPTLGADLPVWKVKVLGRMRSIPAQSRAVAESVARHRTRNGKFDSTFLFTARLPVDAL